MLDIDVLDGLDDIWVRHIWSEWIKIMKTILSKKY